MRKLIVVAVLALLLCGCRTIDLEVVGEDGSNTHLISKSLFVNTDNLVGAEIIGSDGASAKADSAETSADPAEIFRQLFEAGFQAGRATAVPTP